jgi:hypothetical protein
VAEFLRGLLVLGAVGLVAGLASGCLRLHLGLAGHKAMVWMAPVILVRLVARAPAGATVGSLAAGVGMLAAGGGPAGDAADLPVMGLAGALLDVVVGFVEGRRLPAAAAILAVGLAGLGANLVMLARRLLGPVFQSHSFLWASGADARLLSYASFGLAAGLIAATLAHVIRAGRNRGAKRES